MEANAEGVELGESGAVPGEFVGAYILPTCQANFRGAVVFLASRASSEKSFNKPIV